MEAALCTADAAAPATAARVTCKKSTPEWVAPTGSNAVGFLAPAGAALGFCALFIAAAVMVMRSAERRDYATMHPLEVMLAAPPAPVVASENAGHGREVFMTTCAACHGPDATGVRGLGKDLVRSEFVASQDDARLVAFVKSGRPADHPLNTTRVPMPPKGGHDELTDADIADVAGYVRALQDPRRMPALAAYVAPPPAAPTQADAAEALAAAGGDKELAEFIAHGKMIFAQTCSACHGKDAKGLAGQGKDLVASVFVKSLDDDGLLNFIKKGRDPGDPANTTKVGMPPKGGNPALSEDDLLDVIAFVRSLQGPRQVSATN